MARASGSLRLMAVLAHPDDESLGFGGALAKYAAEGVETYLVTATRGERGWTGAPAEYPGPAALGRIREAELRAAAKALGLREVQLLDYIDGDLDQADPAEATAKIVGHLRRVRPHVVLTFDPQGAYGHPDHIAICQLTTAAVLAAASSNGSSNGSATRARPHRVAKLYYMVDSEQRAAAYQAAFGDLVMRVDDAERRMFPWPDWSFSALLDTSAYARQVWEAVACHRSQLPNYGVLERLPAQHHDALWGTQAFYRALSLVNGGRAVECDLFEGLRAPAAALTPAPTGQEARA
jgi:LmbE family N-acetylglucosaminyl deacetylase